MKRQQAVHLGLNLFGRAVLMHAAVELFGIVGTFFGFAFEQFCFEISELISYRYCVLMAQQCRVQFVNITF
jgi:hypothetical protein